MQLLYLISIADEDEKEKIRQIYIQHSRLMMYTAMSILHDKYLAEDAVQNAFIKIMNYSQKIIDVSCPQTKSLIVIITRSASIDIYRQRKVVNMRMEVLDEDIIDDIIIEDQVMKKMEAETILDAIGNLSSMYSDILILTYLHGLSTKEIAGLCGITVEAAKKRLQRARQALKRELERKESDEKDRATFA